ncbi:MAG: 50S ribosomal protein L3 N(5)-glutamine methyltransferase [Gammaproteobacteria bacterium]|nr:50S ribosomal protein L3 N(5)-glutamine methyltransferase [Gammaproteobacteria bacterium]
MICDTKSLETMLDYIRWGASCFATQGLFFGHGTDNALDESVALVLHALKLRHDLPPMYLQSRLTAPEKEAIETLFKRRIKERVPAPYITNEVMFAGFSFYVDEHVLVPRSPIAELIENRFQPWIGPDRVTRILDLCTGSGCIGIACAHQFPRASVDLLDISPQALEVAERNIGQHGLKSRVATIQSDLFESLEQDKYDIIVSNPPYVSSGEMLDLPAEYQHEPALGLEAGGDGLDIVTPLLQQASSYLKPDGIIVVEVGLSADALQKRYPLVPFLWLDFEHGGEGVFMLTAGQLTQYQSNFLEDG